MHFINSNNWNTANITLLDNAELHQLISLNVVPEPSVLMLLMVGGISMAVRRNRRRRHR